MGIDIGGTKTLVATFDNDGTLKEQHKFHTPNQYADFLEEIRHVVDNLTTKTFKAAGVGAPATEMDRSKGAGVRFGNLAWVNAPLRSDLHKLLSCPVVVENDAKLAGLSEAKLAKKYKKVLYITISTGIGTALIANQTIDTAFGDGGGRTLMIEHNNKTVPWESFASGHAIVKQFGKRAEDIHDAKTWNTIAHNLAIGLIEVIAMTEPDIIIVGGGVGNYLERFIDPLNKSLRRFENPLLPIPPIHKAVRADDAVIYGCYDIAKATYG